MDLLRSNELPNIGSCFATDHYTMRTRSTENRIHCATPLSHIWSLIFQEIASTNNLILDAPSHHFSHVRRQSPSLTHRRHNRHSCTRTIAVTALRCHSSGSKELRICCTQLHCMVPSVCVSSMAPDGRMKPRTTTPRDYWQHSAILAARCCPCVRWVGSVGNSSARRLSSAC